MADERGTIQTIFRNSFFIVIPARVFGLLPLRRRGDRLTREGLFGRMCSIFILVVPSLVSIHDLWGQIESLTEYNLRTVFNLQFAFTLCSAEDLLVVFTDVYREFTDAQTGLQIIESLGQYDRKVKQLGLARKDNFLFTWIISLLSILSFFLQLILRFTFPQNTGIFMFIYINGSLIVKLVSRLARLKFLIIVHLLYQRYKHLNEIVLPKDEWRSRGNMAVDRRVVNMHDLVYLHSTLTRATKLLAEAYSFEIFVWANSPIWEFPASLCQAQRKNNFRTYGSTEAAQILVVFLSLCWICRTTANEANKFAMQILRTDPELIRAVDIDEQLDAAIYLYNNKISFRAWKFYEIDYPVLAYNTIQSSYFNIGSLTASLGMIIFDLLHLIYQE